MSLISGLLFVVTAVVVAYLTQYMIWRLRNRTFVEWVRENREYKFTPRDIHGMYLFNMRPISVQAAPKFFDAYVENSKNK